MSLGWQTLEYDTTFICAAFNSRGKTPPGNTLMLLRSVCFAPLSDCAGQCPRPMPHPDHAEPEVCDTKRPQPRSCLPLPGTCGGEGTVPPSTTDSPRAGCRQVRATSSSVTRKSAHLWQALQHVDAPFSPGGLLRGRVPPYQVSLEASRKALKRLGVSWRRAKRWITSSEPHYARKRSTVACDGLVMPGWRKRVPSMSSPR
jgi:hypothetical protein